MSIRHIIHYIYQIIKFICAIIGILAVCVLGYLWFDDKMFCLDIGKIYDPIQKVCRDDCLTWNNEIGCVPITEENIEKKAKGLF